MRPLRFLGVLPGQILSYHKVRRERPQGRKARKASVSNCTTIANTSAFSAKRFFAIINEQLFLPSKTAPLAQLDRASGYEPEGREFESLRAHHFSSFSNNYLRRNLDPFQLRCFGYIGYRRRFGYFEAETCGNRDFLSAFHVLQQLLRGASVSTSPAVKGEGAVSTTETIDEKHRSRNSSALSLRHEQYCSVWRMWLRQTP